MDFNLQEEQQLLLDSVRRFVKEEYNFENRRALAKSDQGYSSTNWQTYAELGWLALNIPEEYGGLGLEFEDVSLLMSGLGEGLVLEPLVSTAILCSHFVEVSDQLQLREETLAKIINGELKLALAYTELAGRFEIAGSGSTTVELEQDGYRISGSKLAVVDAPHADKLIVTATSRENAELLIFLVDKDTTGIRLDSYALIDGTRAADIYFDNVIIPVDALLIGPEHSLDAIEYALDKTTLALAAEAIGGMTAVMSITAEYISTRKQFGQPIGKFQALQHIMAEMLVKTEDARSMLYRGIAALSAEPEQRKAAVSATKVVTAEAGKFVGAEGIQLHGGMGITDECSVGHYYKRMLVFEKLYGDLDYHMQRYLLCTE